MDASCAQASTSAGCRGGSAARPHRRDGRCRSDPSRENSGHVVGPGQYVHGVDLQDALRGSRFQYLRAAAGGASSGRSRPRPWAAMLIRRAAAGERVRRALTGATTSPMLPPATDSVSTAVDGARVDGRVMVRVMVRW